MRARIDHDLASSRSDATVPQRAGVRRVAHRAHRRSRPHADAARAHGLDDGRDRRRALGRRRGRLAAPPRGRRLGLVAHTGGPTPTPRAAHPRACCCQTATPRSSPATTTSWGSTSGSRRLCTEWQLHDHPARASTVSSPTHPQVDRHHRSTGRRAHQVQPLHGALLQSAPTAAGRRPRRLHHAAARQLPRRLDATPRGPAPHPGPRSLRHRRVLIAPISSSARPGVADLHDIVSAAPRGGRSQRRGSEPVFEPVDYAHDSPTTGGLGRMRGPGWSAFAKVVQAVPALVALAVAAGRVPGGAVHARSGEVASGGRPVPLRPRGPDACGSAAAGGARRRRPRRRAAAARPGGCRRRSLPVGCHALRPRCSAARTVARADDRGRRPARRRAAAVRAAARPRHQQARPGRPATARCRCDVAAPAARRRARPARRSRRARPTPAAVSSISPPRFLSCTRTATPPRTTCSCPATIPACSSSSTGRWPAGPRSATISASSLIGLAHDDVLLGRGPAGPAPAADPRRRRRLGRRGIPHRRSARARSAWTPGSRCAACSPRCPSSTSTSRSPIELVERFRQRLALTRYLVDVGLATTTRRHADVA